MYCSLKNKTKTITFQIEYYNFTIRYEQTLGSKRLIYELIIVSFTQKNLKAIYCLTVYLLNNCMILPLRRNQLGFNYLITTKPLFSTPMFGF